MASNQSALVEELTKKLNDLDQKYRKLVIDNQNEKMTSRSKDREIADCKDEIKELKSYWDPSVLERGGSTQFMHAQNNLQSIINSDAHLRRTISMSKERFDDVCARVAERSLQDDLLFYEDGSPRSGNRCRLSRNQTVYMSILLKKADPRQVDLEAWFGINQSTVSRSVDYIDGILVDVLPTAHALQQRIQHAGLATLDQFVPESEVFTDGTEIQVERPQDDEVQKKYYSGKKKRHTVKFTIMANKHGVPIYIGMPHNGSTHDMKMLRLDDPDLGIITDRMKSKRTSEDNKPVSWSDSGYPGIKEIYLGIILMQPIKRRRRKKDEEKQELSRTEKRYNRSVSKIRIKVEHTIGWLKHFDVLRNVYSRSDEHLYRDLQIVSGLINHRMFWNSEEKKLNYGL